jgi:hypothetical protein
VTSSSSLMQMIFFIRTASTESSPAGAPACRKFNSVSIRSMPMVNRHLPFPTYPSTLSSAEVRRRSLSFGYYPWPVSTGNAFAREFVSKVTPIPQERIFKSPDGFLNKMAPLFGDVETIDEILGSYRVHGSNAWAQSNERIRCEGYVRIVRFDDILHAEFVALAWRLGFSVEVYRHQPVPQWVEKRLLPLRLCPREHPIAGDSIMAALRLGLRGSFVAPDLSVVGRASWAIWFVAIAMLPERHLMYLLRQCRAQDGRNSLARLLVHCSLSRPDRGLRKSSLLR